LVLGLPLPGVVVGVADMVPPVFAGAWVRTDDGGQTWTRFWEGLPQQDAYDIVYRHALDASGDRVCFGSTTGNVYLSEDRGESWQCLGSNFPPVHSVRFG